MTISFIIRRLGITLLIAIVFVSILAMMSPEGILLVLPAWAVLFFGWPFLSRGLGFDFPKAPARRKPRPASSQTTAVAAPGPWDASNHWRYRVGTISMSLTVIVPLGLCHRKAQKAHDPVHVGMTVVEVPYTVRNCDIFPARSDFPHDDDAEPDNILAIHLGRSSDGTFWTYDLAAGRDVPMTEDEAVARLHAQLRDGYRWSFRYTDLNLTPRHVSFRVIFGPDGRVREVKPVYRSD